ncbi:MAG: nuclear transport factor 2 family protein [Rhodospirillales bacterium]|nr:nuclear transport factor 2 family protein [Rhodospirillales bacterium]
MANSNVADLILQAFRAYETKDRSLIEPILGADLTFSSPRDDRIDRTVYFDRCWPNADQFRKFHIEKLFVEGDEAFVRYLCEPFTGDRFRNTEYFRVSGGKIVEIDVYFGRSLTGEAP